MTRKTNIFRLTSQSSIVSYQNKYIDWVRPSIDSNEIEEFSSAVVRSDLIFVTGIHISNRSIIENNIRKANLQALSKFYSDIRLLWNQGHPIDHIGEDERSKRDRPQTSDLISTWIYDTKNEKSEWIDHCVRNEWWLKWFDLTALFHQIQDISHSS